MNKLKAFSPEVLLVGPDILLELHQYATANGFEVFLGGGAVRDQVHGGSPKDLDIGVINCPVEHRMGLVDIVMMQNWDVTKVYDEDDTEGYAASFPGEEDRYECIWQFESFIGGLPLDLLFYTDAYPTIASVMASHDHSINQYAAWYGSLGLNVAYLGDQSKYGHCRQLRHGVTAERIHKVKGMCQRLGWTYEALPAPPTPPVPDNQAPPEGGWNKFLDEALG